MSDLIKVLYSLRGLTLYEKYVFLMIVAHWMDTYLKFQKDIDWVESQITRMEKELLETNSKVSEPFHLEEQNPEVQDIA